MGNSPGVTEQHWYIREEKKFLDISKMQESLHPGWSLLYLLKTNSEDCVNFVDAASGVLLTHRPRFMQQHQEEVTEWDWLSCDLWKISAKSVMLENEELYLFF
jgi:hypothetical protein